jgi:hypothetical protein
MPTPTRTTTTPTGLQVKTHVKAGGWGGQHNETLVRSPRPATGLKVKTHVKAGFPPGHCPAHDSLSKRHVRRPRP